jgi:small multidrug resistance pump
MGLCYLGSFYLLTHALKTIPLGIAYAVWSGLGIVLVSAIGVVVFRQTLDLPALIGLGFIITGVLIVNLFSSSVGH